MQSETIRYVEEGESIFFPKTNQCVHKSFTKRYIGLTIPQTRRKMKKMWATRSEQNELIHYLKHKKLIKY